MLKSEFDQSGGPSLRDQLRFMRSVMQCIWESQQNISQVYGFFQTNLAWLDQPLIDALPAIFSKLIAFRLPKTRQNVAASFLSFGHLIQQFPQGNRKLNLELSIAAYQLSKEILTQNAFLNDWIAAQISLGNAYCDRIQGDRAENLEQAILAYSSALQCIDRDAFPEKWAGTQNNLGVAYRDRIRGDRAENLEQAIAAYRLALQVRTRDAFPEKWAGTQNNLGNVYRDRIRGDRAENLEQAIVAYNLALQVITRDASPEKWAGTQNNLGAAYRDRIQGDRAENLERAIAAFNLALQVRTQDAFPEEWAGTLNNLGNTYSEHIRGDRAENLEQAIALYDQAAQVFTQSEFPAKWSENRGHLAEALTKRAFITHNFADLDTAIALLQVVLEIASPGSPNFINCQYRLGIASSRRYEHSQNPSDLEQALQAYKVALHFISPEHYDREQIWQALPTTQAILGSRLVEEGKWQEGLQLLLNSVTQLSIGDDPLAHANALYQIGRAHETLSDWDNARTYYRDALRLYKHLEELPGIAKSQAGLGGVLVSQGHLAKGISELKASSELYYQLQQPQAAATVENLYQAAQRAC